MTRQYAAGSRVQVDEALRSREPSPHPRLDPRPHIEDGREGPSSMRREHQAACTVAAAPLGFGPY